MGERPGGAVEDDGTPDDEPQGRGHEQPVQVSQGPRVHGLPSGRPCGRDAGNAASSTRRTIGAAESPPRNPCSTNATTTTRGASVGAYPANQACGFPRGFSALPVFPAIVSPFPPHTPPPP